jgi:long-chain acyl-CoA synthetase
MLQTFRVSSGNMLKLKEDHAAIKTTIFVSVPRLFNRICETLKSTIDGMVNGEEAKRAPIENAVFQKFRQSLGGKVRILVTGSAPIHPAVQEYMQRAVGCPFIEGYGQTESPTALLIGRKTHTSFSQLH